MEALEARQLPENPHGPQSFRPRRHKGSGALDGDGPGLGAHGVLKIEIST